jgi:hypothetical protein
MPTTSKQVLNQGTSNPIVARTIHQAGTIMDVFPLTDNIKDHIFSINLGLCKRLLAMDDFAKWIERECETIRLSFFADGLKKIGDNAFEAPQVIELEARAESFIQAAKLCIRDCGQIFGSLVGETFNHKYHEVIKWAGENFGKDDELVKWLTTQEPWIKNILDMRNALEHPSDKPREKLHIMNVEVSFSSTEEPTGVSLEAPQWFLTGEPPTSIVIDAKNIIQKILVLSEDILSASTEKLYSDVPITFRVIPEAKRDPDCPVRLELIPRGYLDGA